nr:immunoglobulin light chain junction region [Macaca mulatta]MOV72420.1 immunoglobulin light chain junction region [Macaca mulatta]MOV72842.1 immunoglobulin light chain junction region [Macaca mulatta]MOV73123.1 immunoglobulin light chain junction region [Macaca mulatta]MOV73374.1 immunoglobulin light chain junction region [Macaca mulatta]
NYYCLSYDTSLSGHGLF